ncbi:MAG TPA: radical SAM protein [bacterium]|nr:radical SAM protein [bacterium]
MNKQKSKSMSGNASGCFYDPFAENIEVSGKCNQNCFFCSEKSTGGTADEAPETISEKLRAARKTTDAVIFTGGEPTIDRHLAGYIEEAAGLAYRTICLETNGLMMSYPAYTEKILASGLTHIVFLHISHRPGVSDAATKYPGGWELSRRGIELTAGTGVETAIRIPLLKQTIAGLDQHVQFIGKNFPHAKHIFLDILNGDDGASIAEMETILPGAIDEAGKAGTELHFKPGGNPAPCLFQSLDAIGSLFIFPPVTGENETSVFRRPRLCEDCYLRFFCKGIHPRFDTHNDSSLAAPSAGFAGSVLKQWPGGNEPARTLAGVENEFVIPGFIEKDGKKYVEEVLLRINYTCNQRCLFCWIDPCFVNPQPSKVKSYIKELRNYEVGSVCISGGEPTLNKNLVEYVKMLKTGNIRKVGLQTNAVLLHRESNALALREAGLDFALVSLHSHSPEVSDMLTGLPGSFSKTVRGISNLRKNGIMVLISHVINSFNFASLSRFVEFSASALDRTPIVFSVAAPIYGAMITRGMMPRMSELKSHLSEALDLCYELRVPFSGLTAMCGIPLCILDGNPRYFPDARVIDSGSENRDMLKTEACSNCGLTGYCFGVRKNYAAFYGTGELHPINAEGFKPREMDVWNTDFFKVYLDEKFGF